MEEIKKTKTKKNKQAKNILKKSDAKSVFYSVGKKNKKKKTFLNKVRKSFYEKDKVFY